MSKEADMSMVTPALIALGIFLLTYSLSFERGSLAKRLQVIMGKGEEEENGLASKIGSYLGEKLPFLTGKLGIKEDLEVLRLSGNLLTEETVYGLLALSGLGGLALGYLAFGTLGLFIGLLAGPFVFYQVFKGRANRMRREILRDLPDVENIMAIEIATGANIRQALQSAASSPTAFGRWLRDILDKEKDLVRASEKLGIPELVAFARQVELVSKTGLGGEAFADLAKETIRARTSEMNAKIAKLESELAMPSVLFFFLPFVFILLALTGIALVGSGLFGG